MCKEEGKHGEIMRKVVKESPGLNVRGKLRKVGNVFLRKRKVSTHEVIKGSLSLSMRSSNIGCDFGFTGPSEKRLRVLRLQDVLQKMHPEDTNIFTNGMIEKDANCPDDLEKECYGVFSTGYVKVNTKDVVEDNDIENYTTPVSNPDEEELNEENFIILKNGPEKMRKRTQSRIMRYHKVSELEDPELHFMTFLQLYMSWRNEDNLKRDCSTYAEKSEFVKDDVMSNI